MTFERSEPRPAYFLAWDENGTRYRIFATILAAFKAAARDEIGAGPTAILVTLWFSGGGKSAIFNAGGGPLVDAYIGEKLDLTGEDLAAVAPALRDILLRSDGLEEARG